VPIGTKVRVVNEPFVFGWQDDKLYMQAFDVLEDDSRDWQKAPKKLISKSLSADVQKQLKKRDETVDWDLIMSASRDPRGIPIAISGTTSTVEEAVANAPRVQNMVPDGASWDGKTDLPMDEATFQEMLSDRDPQASPSTGGSAAAAAPAPAPAQAPPAAAATKTGT
jgi:L,D-transpeptidase ErfK/SrfK